MKKINPCYFTDRVIYVAYYKYLDSHYISHLDPKMINKPNHSKIGKIHVTKILKQLSTEGAGTIYQCK